jgi:transmembrane sensor
MTNRKNSQIYEEASEWLVELRTGEVDAGTRERLDAWFRASPEHIRAYLELSSIWEDGGDPDLDRAHSTDALIALARTATNVIPLERPEKVKAAATAQTAVAGAKPIRRKVSTRFLMVASVGAASVVAGLVGLWFLASAEPSYATRTGEEKSVQLPDGSSLQLNSRSRIRVRFSEHEREVDLLEGQALFKVAKDSTRPFVVHSDSARVRAVGTQFDVYKKDSGTTVTVVEGRVAVLAKPHEGPNLATLDAGAPDAIILMAGEQVTVAPSTATKPRKADVATATAWTQHQLVFDSTPLTAVAQEFNRYNVRQLIVSDDGLQDFHVTGIFSSTDPASLLRFLRAQRGITVDETDTAIRISKQ